MLLTQARQDGDHMMHTASPKTIGGTWLSVTDDSRISYQVEEGGRTVEFSFLGPVELGIGMTEQLVQRCQELFSEALAEMSRVQEIGSVD
jgi:hypothetical protein